MEIEIRNWEKYNPKRAQRTYTWLRLDNDFARCEEMYGLSNEEKYVTILLLCEASKKGRGRFTLAKKWFCSDVAKVGEDMLDALIKKLSEKGLTGTEPFIIIHDAPSLQRTTPDYPQATPHYPRTTPTDVRTNGRTISPVGRDSSLTHSYVDVSLPKNLNINVGAETLTSDLPGEFISEQLSQISEMVRPEPTQEIAPNEAGGT